MITDIGTVDGVGDGFLAIVDFLRIGTLAQIENRPAQTEVRIELMLDTSTQEGFLHGAEGRVGFQRDIDGRAAAEDAFVDDGDSTEGVVDGVVDVLDKLGAACRYRHRALCHVHGVEVDFATRLRRIEALQREFVFLGILFGRGLRHGVE